MSQEPALTIISCECGQKMKVPANALGKTFKCVKCGAHIQLPAGAAPPSVATAPDEVPPALEPLGQLLVQSGCITPLQLDEALGVQRREGGKTFEILIRLGYLDKARLHEVLSKQQGIATIDLGRVTIDRALVKLVPREMALSQLILPIDQLGKLLTVAMACPLDVATIAALEQTSGLKVKAMLCRYDDIQVAVQKQYPDNTRPEGELHTFQMPAGYDSGPKDDVAEKLGRVEELHYRVEILDQVLALAKSGSATLGVVMDLLSQDAAFAAALLRTANNSVYGMSAQVDSLALALTLLGREALGAVAAQCKKSNVVAQGNTAPLYARAAMTARNAAVLARATGRVSRELAYTAGLLHVVGSFAMEAASSQRYGKLKTDVEPATLAKEEKQALGLTHGEAALILLKRWRLPESLQLAAGHYLAPEGAQKQAALATLVRSAAAGSLEQAAEAAGAKPDALARAQREEDQLWESQRTVHF